MKNPIRLAALALPLATFYLPPSTSFAQGSLTPPGAPAAMMKTLDQVEPRTIVNAANTPGDSSDSFVISQPGSYYLAANLTGVSGKNGIAIAANNVSLDLNGFALSGAGNNYGVYITGGRTNTIVRNGSISGWNCGIYDLPNYNTLCERLAVSSCSADGIVSPGIGVVANCTVRSCGGVGIYAAASTVSGCTAQSCGSGINADSSTVSGCTAQSCGFGINASSSTVSGCSAQSCNVGIYADASTVSGCCVSSSTNSGIFADGPGCQIIGNNCRGNNTSASTYGAGIYLEDANNRVEDNHVSASGYAGIQVYNYSSYTGNIIIRNTVSGNGANNYLTPGNQIVGPLITTYGSITNSNPWANFSF